MFELENSNEFLQYTNAISDSLSKVIENDNKQGATEPRIVEDSSNAINSVQAVSDHLESSHMFSSVIHAAFIHGRKSFVEFSMAGSRKCFELGDIVFISSLAWRGKIAAERITINQVKKQNSKSRSSVLLKIQYL